MKMKIEIEGELFEDQDTMKIYVHALDMYSALADARQKIRSRIKWGEELSEAEEHTLTELLGILWVEGIDL